MKDKLINELAESIQEAGAIRRGEKAPTRAFEVNDQSIKEIRSTYDLTQKQFAAMLGISLATLRNWEQGRRSPDGPARILLRVAARHPDAILNVVRPVEES